jgi:uncharacterized membrane protein (UPF0127 family)
VADHVDLTRADDGAPVCRARVARSFASRFLGLMGRKHLPPGRGLLFPGASSVHTHFMRFPIDVVFLDDALCVVSIATRLRPWRFASAKGASSVLELAAGECERIGLAVGDVLSERPD